MKHAILLVALVGALLGQSAPSARKPPRPVDVFAELDGRWAGTFVGYDATGRELYRIKVEQVYETVDANTQRVRITDTMPDGTVIRGEGENVATRAADGSLTLECLVRKSNGERVRHAGRLVKGPDGHRQLVWWSKEDGREETFREHVRREGERTVYEINGMGRYGGTSMLMTGRYYRGSGSGS
ncbi:MAG: hypothetical protein ACYTGP_08905 [Planctomycetota bacterium]|jgi:hypothetical protein